jgi:hypothetical protein
MGRPPLGDAAMTSAERVRRWRERHGKARNETRNEKPCNETDNETATAHTAELQARVAELEALLAMPTHAAVRNLFERLAEQVSANRHLQRDAKKTARAEVEAEVTAKIKALEAKVARFEAEPDAAYAARIKSLEARLKAARTQAADARAAANRLRDSSTLVLTKVELSTLRKALHPDAANNEAALTKAAQLLNGLINDKRILIEGEAAREG